MPYSDYRPELMGRATLEPTGQFEAGSMQSFTLVYTAGKFGIDDTGSIKIGFRFATDFGPVQFDKPEAAGYTTAEASNGATLELKWEFKRNIRPWSRSLYVGVMKHFLKPGDTITIRFGDRRQGSPGIRLQTYAERAFEFHVLVDAIATYDYVALPESPKIAIVAGSGVQWRAVLPTLVRSGEAFRFGVRADDKWGNPSPHVPRSLIVEPSRPVAGLPRTIEFAPGAQSAIVDGLTLDDDGELQIAVKTTDGRELVRSNTLHVAPTDASLVHYWGDTHGQSDETLGTGSAREYFEFGRDRAFLDVMGHQGNDFQITGAFWRDLNELTRSLDKPGRFVAIPGYEWSANTAVGGDRNVHFRHEGETIHRSSHAQIADVGDMVDEHTDAHTAADLFRALAGRDCVVAAHVGGRYADITLAHDGRLETAVEVHSAWGTFEWLLHDAFAKGYRVGIVANSDGHKGRPGACTPGASFFGSMGGLTCFLAPRLDRDAVFEAMRRRHHYATTGNRMSLAVEVTTARPAVLFERDPDHFPDTRIADTRHMIMGDIAEVADAEVDLVIDVVGSAPIERVDVFDATKLIETYRPFSDSDLGARIRLLYQGAEYRGRARTTIWDGVLELEANGIASASVLNNWNLDRGIQKQSRTSLEWKAVTTGNFGGIDIRLEAAREGRLAFETAHCQGILVLAQIGLEDRTFEGGGLDRAVRFYRLPDRMSERRVTLRRKIRLSDTGDTRLYVRVTQEDGHRAWSSPIYLYRSDV
ncbi:MAG TPA: DUF3604 domain-containing protein [Hyphomicrobiaceae bacterium]|nr:DUF3604 domain-containing protein [Hyphomicrobiaceae bacterium]